MASPPVTLLRHGGALSIAGSWCLHQGIDVLAAKAPGLHGALLAAEAAGYSHVNIDGMLVETDRCRTPGRYRVWTCGGRASTTTTAAISR